MRLIEKKNDSIGTTVDNGAVLNRAAVSGKNGALYGFEITNTNGSVRASKGRLIVGGFTFETLETEELFDITSFTATTTDPYIIYLQITFDTTTRDATYTISALASNTTVTKTAIWENQSGTYHFALAKFVKSEGTITSFISLVKQIDVSGGSSAGSQIVVPQPTLMVGNNKAGTSGVSTMYNGWLFIGNRSDFLTLSQSYKVKFIMFRRLQKGRYKRATNFYTHKTHWCEVTTAPGWNELVAWTKRSIDFTELTEAQIYSLGTYSGVIDTVANLISAFFYELTSDVRSAVTISSPITHIRATRSKSTGQALSSGKRWKYNYVELAYKARVYDVQTGNFLGESAMSNPIVITVTGKGQDGRTISSMGDLFQIRTL